MQCGKGLQIPKQYAYIDKLACQKCIPKQYVCTFARLILTGRFNVHRSSARRVEKEVLDRQPKNDFDPNKKIFKNLENNILKRYWATFYRDFV